MIKKNLVVKNGSYTNGAGETKHRWVVIGQLHGGQDKITSPLTRISTSLLSRAKKVIRGSW